MLIVNSNLNCWHMVSVQSCLGCFKVINPCVFQVWYPCIQALYLPINSNSSKILQEKEIQRQGGRASPTSDEGNSPDRRDSFPGSWGPGAAQEQQQEGVPSTCYSCRPDCPGTEPPTAKLVAPSTTTSHWKLSSGLKVYRESLIHRSIPGISPMPILYLDLNHENIAELRGMQQKCLVS